VAPSQQVRGLALLLWVALVYTVWRLWTLN
jgi:hypothetical protein